MTTTKTNEQLIFIGGKPLMSYVTGVVTKFNRGAKKITIKARGKFISKCVDVAEVTRRKLLKDDKISVKNISIGSKDFKNSEDKTISVSSLKLTLEKGD